MTCLGSPMVPKFCCFCLIASTGTSASHASLPYSICHFAILLCSSFREMAKLIINCMLANNDKSIKKRIVRCLYPDITHHELSTANNSIMHNMVIGTIVRLSPVRSRRCCIWLRSGVSRPRFSRTRCRITLIRSKAGKSKIPNITICIPSGILIPLWRNNAIERYASTYPNT